MKTPKPYAGLTDEKVYSVDDIDASLTYTYAHYLNWLFDDRVELIKGKVFRMSPAPSRFHQKVSVRISASLFNYLKNRSCEVYTAPFDVRFPNGIFEDKDIYTFLQPDLCVICDSSKLDDRGCIGAPDIVIEILSPGNNKKELLYKYSIYEEFGVKEYWVIDPLNYTVQQHSLDISGKYIASGLFTMKDHVQSDILPGFELSLAELFEE